MKITTPKMLGRKVLFAILPVLGMTQIIAWQTLNINLGLTFLLSVIFYIFVIWEIESKTILRYYSFNSVRLLLFFLPIAAIIFSFGLTGSLLKHSSSGAEAVGGAIGGVVGGFMVIILSLIIGLIGGLIVGSINKKPTIEKNEYMGVSQGWMFVFIIILSIFLSTISSSPLESEKMDTIGLVNSGTTQSGVSTKVEDTKAIENKSILSKIEVLDKKIIEGQFGTKEFSVSMKNSTGKDIDGIRLKASFKNNFGEPVESFSDKYFRGESQELLKNGATDVYRWSLFSFDKATSVDEVVIFSIHFKGGETINIE